MSRRFRILVVCTGNIGRSPMAERLLDRQLRARAQESVLSFDVSSAGTQGLVGAPMEEFAASALSDLGVRADGFQARLLTPHLVSESDLILTATREHRAAAVTLAPGAVRRTFTLNEFARLSQLVNDSIGPTDPPSDGDPAPSVRGRIDLAGRLRGTGERPSPEADDIQDPLGAPLETYRTLAAEIDRVCLRAVDLLLGAQH